MAAMTEATPSYEDNVGLVDEQQNRTAGVADQQEVVRVTRGSSRTVFAGRSRSDVAELASEGDDVGWELIDARMSKNWQPRRAFVVTVALMATVAVAWLGSQAVASATAKPVVLNQMGPARSLLQSPELHNLLVDELRSVDDSDAQIMAHTDLHKDVRQLMNDLGQVLDDNLEPDARQALQRAHVDPGMWADMRRIFDAVREPQLMQLGRQAYAVVSNMSATPGDMQQLLLGSITLSHKEIANLQSRVIPSRFLASLRALASKGQKVDLGFSPKALEQMRRQDKPRQQLGEGGVSLATYVPVLRAGANAGSPSDTQKALRRLDSGGVEAAGAERKLSLSTPLGISALGLTFILEVFIQIQLIFSGFSMPPWLWGLFSIPAIGAGSSECGVFGLNAYCDVFIGLMGFNLLEFVMPMMR